nr:YIP1 family protein [Altererythrobacter sp. KTW20L]
MWVVAYVANYLSPRFGGRDDYPAAFRLVTYSWTAAWLAGIFGLIPMLSILGILGLYSLYLLYKGATPVMGVPQDKAVGFTAVTIIAAIVAMFLVNLVIGLFTAPTMMAGTMGSGMGDRMSIDMGESGRIDSNADGTMTITGPDGETMTITIDTNEAE